MSSAGGAVQAGSVVVSGAGQGIGHAIVVRLARAGQRVWCVDIAEQPLMELVDRLRAEGADVRPVVSDLADPDGVARVWQQVDDEVTALVNNAGIFPRRSALEITRDEWERVLSVNLSASFYMAQEAARRIVARGGTGAIVSIASGQAYRPSPAGAHYAASKAGLVNLTRALAREWGSLGIRVNAVVPGLTDTAQPRAVMDDDDLEAAAAEIPLGRIGAPDDVAAAVAFLLSDDASHVTGHALAVNGGALMI